MKVRMLRDAHVRITAGISRSFQAGSVVTVSTANGQKLISAGAAEPAGIRNPSVDKET